MDNTMIYMPHTTQTASPVELLLKGMVGITQEKDQEIYTLKQKCNELEKMAQCNLLPTKSIVSDGKQNELVAIFNVLYESGMVSNCTKSEFIKRIADAFGAPGMAANFSKALYNIKLTYKYDEIFEKFNEAAQVEKKK